jgi:hypothetical protein
MVAFDPDDMGGDRLDYQLAMNGFVTLFWSREVLIKTTNGLTGRGYRLVQADASSWRTSEDMHTEVARVLEFPDYYGRNSAALNDCLSDVAKCRYGFSRDDTGLAFVLTGFDQFCRRDTVWAHGLLDIFATQARTAALFGHRMLCLVQSDDPKLTVPPVGATPVSWNPAEWLDSKRIL